MCMLWERTQLNAHVKWVMLISVYCTFFSVYPFSHHCVDCGAFYDPMKYMSNLLPRKFHIWNQLNYKQILEMGTIDFVLCSACTQGVQCCTQRGRVYIIELRFSVCCMCAPIKSRSPASENRYATLILLLLTLVWWCYRVLHLRSRIENAVDEKYKNRVLHCAALHYKQEHDV